jgi:hypothetical protein
VRIKYETGERNCEDIETEIDYSNGEQSENGDSE